MTDQGSDAGSMKVKGSSVETTVGLWIDHREAVIVFISPQGEVSNRQIAAKVRKYFQEKSL